MAFLDVSVSKRKYIQPFMVSTIRNNESEVIFRQKLELKEDQRKRHLITSDYRYVKQPIQYNGVLITRK